MINPTKDSRPWLSLFFNSPYIIKGLKVRQRGFHEKDKFKDIRIQLSYPGLILYRSLSSKDTWQDLVINSNFTSSFITIYAENGYENEFYSNGFSVIKAYGCESGILIAKKCFYVKCNA